LTHIRDSIREWGNEAYVQRRLRGQDVAGPAADQNHLALTSKGEYHADKIDGKRVADPVAAHRRRQELIFHPTGNLRAESFEYTLAG
jgi:hypothetical protein